MKQLEKYFGISLAIFAVIFSLWLYRFEPTTKVDPNDNSFQYALVDRTNQIWDFAYNNCSHNLVYPFCLASLLLDHWVPNWSEGYNLPYYYSHIPQILIVSGFRIFHVFIPELTLFSFYHLTIYLLLCLLPLSVFLGLRIIGLPWLAAGFGAITTNFVSTDGLYGLDPTSYIYRGWGLSSQLFAAIWLPLGLAYSFNYLVRNKPKHLIPAIIFLIFTAAGHLGLGMMALLSLIPLALAEPLMNALLLNFKEILNSLLKNLTKVAILGSGTVFTLSYWIIPAMLNDKFHNFSVWDPIWKFNSYGAFEILKNLFNGNILDFGRFPILTILLFVGLFAALSRKIFDARSPSLISNATKNISYASSGAKKIFDEEPQYAALTFLFIFWLFMYFGRTTWGGILDLIPGLSEFHQSRFIVGVQLSALFLSPIGLAFLIGLFNKLLSRFKNIPDLLIYLSDLLIIGLLFFTLLPQPLKYAKDNDALIQRANAKYDSAIADMQILVNTLRDLPPGRVYPGRGGTWGKSLKIGETAYYMYLSSVGVSTVLWLPETWSPNADTEQYFDESILNNYELYNIRYVVAPADPTIVTIQPFWKLIKETPAWKLYEVPTSGFITTGIVPAIISINKNNFRNVEKLWIRSGYSVKHWYPELTYDSGYPKNTGLPNFKMIDEANYMIPNGSVHNLFAEIPVYQPEDRLNLKILNSSEDSEMIFKANIEVTGPCPNCLVILKETYHPNWRVLVNGNPVKPVIVFPFYTAILLENPGKYEVVFQYQTSGLKIFLSITTIVVIGGLIIYQRLRRSKMPKN